MKGLALSRSYFDAVGRPALEKNFPDLFPRMAVGLAGEGSECFGFDDDLSRDHDWGAGFCIWLTQSDFHSHGWEVQQCYNALPHDDRFPARTDTPEGGGRVGVLSIPNWYHRYTGGPAGPETLAQWRAVPESFLATAVNGAVFHDPLGEFSAVRQRLLAFYPEDIRLKKLAARCAVMAQAGQYNFPRCLRRDEGVAARLALAEFTKAAMSAAYLLSRRYAPYYKWMHRGLLDLPLLPELHGLLAGLTDDDTQGVEAVCALIAGELRRQGLSGSNSTFLLDHCPHIVDRIRDPELRRSHFMED